MRQRKRMRMSERQRKRETQRKREIEKEKKEKKRESDKEIRIWSKQKQVLCCYIKKPSTIFKLDVTLKQLF